MSWKHYAIVFSSIISTAFQWSTRLFCCCALIWSLALMGCEAPVAETNGSGQFTIDAQLASDIRSDAPATIGIVSWSFDLAPLTRAQIAYGPSREYGMVAPIDLQDTPFRTVLLGMKPRSDYHYRITVEHADGTVYNSRDQILTTGPVVNLATVEAFSVFDETTREPGFIVSTLPSSSDVEGRLAFVVDADGEIVWWYRSNREDKITWARISCDGKNVWMIYANNSGEDGALERVTIDTLQSETYVLPGASHDLTPVVDNIVAFINYTEECSQIVEIDPSGDTRLVFDTAEVFSGAACHANALRYSATEDVYTLSDLSHHDIIQVSRDGELNWRLEEIPQATWSGNQHGHHLLDDSLVIFDNGDPGDNAVVREISLKDGATLFRYTGGIMSHLLGDVQRLPGGNTLVAYSLAGHVREIDPEGAVVMSFTMSTEVGYASWRDSLYGPPSDIVL